MNVTAVSKQLAFVGLQYVIEKQNKKTESNKIIPNIININLIDTIESNYNVAYLSCQKKKCTCVNNRCIRLKISGGDLDCRRVELSTNVTLAGSRWMSNYYITPATGSSEQLQRRCWNENYVPAETAPPPGPRLSSPGERKRKAVIARRVGGSICCGSVQSPTHFSRSNTFLT